MSRRPIWSGKQRIAKRQAAQATHNISLPLHFAQWPDQVNDYRASNVAGTHGDYHAGIPGELHRNLMRPHQQAKPKREPLIVDRFLAEPRLSHVPKQYDQTTRDNLRLAHRFVLDDTATRYAAEMTHTTPEIIADGMDFVRAPFERTYIEFPFHTWWRTMTGKEPDADGDYRVGYLIVRNSIRLLSYVRDMPVGLYPLSYELWNPFTLTEQLALAKKLDTSRLAFDVFFWGESVLKFVKGKMATTHTFDVDTEPFTWSRVHAAAARGDFTGTHRIELPKETHMHSSTEEVASTVFDETRLRILRANHRFVFHSPELETPEMWRTVTQGACGELRNVLALLLFLNRTSKLRVEYEEPTVQRMWKTRPIPLLKHRVITLRVNPLPKLLKIAADRASGMKKRRHDVRGHYCHNRTARTNDHPHVWTESREDHLQWRCECGGLRWWKKPHVRGSADKGVITAQYQVKE